MICPLVMLGLSLILPKRYTATMSLMLDPSIRVASSDNPNAALGDMIGMTRTHSIETEIDKLQGSEVLLNAIQLTAQQHPKAFLDQDQAEARYASLVNRIRIDNNRNSDIVDLRVTMDDPQLAADTANNIGKAYMAFNDKISAASGSGALIHIDKELNDKEKELSDLDAKIAAIKTKYNMTDPAVTGPMHDKQVKDMEFNIAQTQSEYNGALGELNAARQALATTPKYLQTTSGVQLNPQALDLDQKISQSESDLEAAKAKYTDDYPLVKQLQEKVNDLKAKRAHTPTNVVARQDTSLNPNYTNAVAAMQSAQSKVESYSGSLQALQQQYAHMQSEGSAYPEAEKQLSALTLQKTSLQNQYQQLQINKQGIDVNGGAAREAQAQIVSIAMPPGTPSFPNPKVFVLMGLAVGIIISALIVMPKAPDIMYAPSTADTLALDGTSMRTTASALPPIQPEPAAVRPAIEPGTPS